MADRAERRNVLLDALKSRRAELKKEFKDQRKMLMKIKAATKLMSDVGVDTENMQNMASEGIKAVSTLQEYMDRILAETEQPKKPES